LIVAGVRKLRDPIVLRPLVDTVGLPLGLTVPLARTVGLVELSVALLVFSGSWIAVAAMAVLYASFTALFVGLRLAGHRKISCGCFGSDDTPLGVLHGLGTCALSVNALLAALIYQSRGTFKMDFEVSWAFLGAVLLAVVGTYLGILIFTDLVRVGTAAPHSTSVNSVRQTDTMRREIAE
jgi:hypothetical protein